METTLSVVLKEQAPSERHGTAPTGSSRITINNKHKIFSSPNY